MAPKLFVVLPLLCASLSLHVRPAAACAGCVQLTEYTFDKLLPRFDAVLVKFDVAFPYGEKHETYSELAKEARALDELLVAEVGVKDYGERDNENLAKRYGIKKEDYPVVKLFVKGGKEPATFGAKRDFTAENLRRFVKEEAGVHMSLPGCLPDLDRIVLRFNEAKDEAARRERLGELEKATAAYDKDKKATARVYQMIMQKVIDKGAAFVTSENERVKKLLDGKLSPEKKKELNAKINILASFQAASKKDEL